MQNYNDLKVDLSNCDKEPIHIIGQIQPHGFMLILDAESLRVEQVSSNSSAFLDVTPETLPGQTLATLCNAQDYAHLEKQLRQTKAQQELVLQLQDKSFFGFVHEAEGKVVVECEPLVPRPEALQLEAVQKLAAFQTALNSPAALGTHATLLVNFVQDVLDYDRVMLYVFDSDWNGEVIAEKVKPGVYSYLHHHFPASDIPAQARALLEVKHVRQIPDVDAKAVKIVPYLNPSTNSPVNILQSELRNPSEIHLEYLRNMGVGATLSFSILVSGKLWGLITCQHESPLFIEFWRRKLCNQAALAFANAVLSSRELRDVDTFRRYKQNEERLIEQVNQCGSVAEGLLQRQVTLLGLVECCGVALQINDELHLAGQTPQPEEVALILDWLSRHNMEPQFHTRTLSKLLPEASAFKDKASGLMAVEISRYNKEYILYFKPEQHENRIWAGNPEKPKPAVDHKIHPRKSFRKWTEVMKGKSRPWTTNELEISQVLLKDLTAIILRDQALEMRGLNKELQQKNNRLEDFAHIIAHNLRSPLNNVKGLCQLYEAEPSEETSQEVMQRISTSVDNMTATLNDLNQVLRAALDQQLPQDHLNLQQLIEKELQNLANSLAQTGAQITMDLGVKQLRYPKVYLESILHNLLSNALKYGVDKAKPLIHIKSWQEGPLVGLSVKDNGTGMNLHKVGPKLFGLYNTFHGNKNAKGLGLYLTKMQLEAMGGSIAVESTPGYGSTFSVWLQTKGGVQDSRTADAPEGQQP